MHATDLRLVELLDFMPERGQIAFRGRRMLLWDADAFGNLRRELFDAVGWSSTRAILMRFGFANGYRDALSTRELFSWIDDSEWWRSCPALQGHQGKVGAEVRRLSIDRAAGRFDVEVIWRASYEAAQHLRVAGVSPHPVCWTLAGFASGFSSAVMGEDAFVIEQECVAMGHDHCRVVGKTRRDWGARAEDVSVDYDVPSLVPGLDARAAESRRAARESARRVRPLHTSDLAATDAFTTRCVAMERVLEVADKVASVDVTVLITGESGTGKERIARRIHDHSARAGRPLVAVNCGALPEPLLESELFGHVRGSFTGAIADKPGLFDAARGGTLFLDEVAEMSTTTQVKLLRVLQEREVRPIGATTATAVDVRVIAATNRDLDAMVSSGAFRQDLFYRLQVVRIELPPLRERREDILPLARELLARSCVTHRVPLKSLSPEVAGLLAAYAWPGNVRELENAIEHAVALSGDALKVAVDHVPATLRGGGQVPVARLLDENMTLDELERRYTLIVLERNRGSRVQTARALGIGTNTLWRRLRAWDIRSGR